MIIIRHIDALKIQDSNFFEIALNRFCNDFSALVGVVQQDLLLVLPEIIPALFVYP